MKSQRQSNQYKYLRAKYERDKQAGRRSRRAGQDLFYGHGDTRVDSRNKQWLRDVRCQYRSCFACGSTEELTVKRLISFREMVKRYKITSPEEALATKDLWSLSNGVVLCKNCLKQQRY